jgi:hypothetical protein
VDVSNLYVTPGLIDIHYHVGHGGAPLDWFAVDARAHALPLGIPADLALQAPPVRRRSSRKRKKSSTVRKCECWLSSTSWPMG